MKYSHSSFVRVAAISSGVASQKAFIRLIFSLAPDPLDILLALDSFRSLPPTKYGSYRLVPSISTNAWGISECDLTSSSRCATSLPSKVVAIVDCEGFRLNAGVVGSDGFILIELPREAIGDTSRVCCNRPGASCSSLMECLRPISHRTRDRLREGVPIEGLSGALWLPCFRSRSSSSWAWSGLSSVRPQKRSGSFSGFGAMLSIKGRSS